MPSKWSSQILSAVLIALVVLAAGVRRFGLEIDEVYILVTASGSGASISSLYYELQDGQGQVRWGFTDPVGYIVEYDVPHGDYTLTLHPGRSPENPANAMLQPKSTNVANHICFTILHAGQYLVWACCPADPLPSCFRGKSSR